MADESRRTNPGALLAVLGFLIFGAVIVANYFGRRIPFLGENLFLPIVMIFAGRAMSRRARSRDTSHPQPVTQDRPRSATRTSPQPPRSLTSRPDPSRSRAPDVVVAPAPSPKMPSPLAQDSELPVIKPVPSPEPRRADPVHYPETGRVARTPPTEPRRSEPVHYPETGRTAKARKTGVKPKSSAEMVDEAKKRLRRGD